MGINVKTTQRTILEELPVHAHWLLHGTSLDFDFSEGRSGLRCPTNEIVEAHPEWLEFLVFGKYDYAASRGILG